MQIRKTIFIKVSALGWFALILVACAGAGTVEPLPTPEPTMPSEPTKTLEPMVTSTEEQPAIVEEGPTRKPADNYADLEIVTLLPRDAIPAIDNPQFLPSAVANEFYEPDELVIGVEFDGDARAYSVPFLSNHEIVNDTVSGVKIAVTW